MVDFSQYLDESFDDRAVAPSTGVPDPVPAGEYQLQMESDDLVTTKDGTGLILKMTLVILSGPFEGRKIFPQFNIKNKSAQAQTISIADYKALCLACGVDYEIARTTTEPLHYKPFKAMVGFDKEQINGATGQPYPPKNRVMKYLPAGQAAAATTAPARTAVPAAAARPASPQGGLPWKKTG